MANSKYSEAAIEAVTKRERERFAAANPRSAKLAEEAKAGLYGGVPMHWMADWPSPFPLFVERAKDAEFVDVDGHTYVDFCLGDTGTMFGHAPAPVAAAIREQSERGYTTMLPSPDAVWIGQELSRRFGLPQWQVAATATDANRYALRWARAVTGRSKILVFDGCYHGTVEETLVRLKDGKAVPRSGQIGAVLDVSKTTSVVEFNDVPALEAALRTNEIAAVLAEPAMTNIGMVLPDEGFHETLRRLTRETGTLLIIDETHTISTGPGGWTKAFNLDPDIFVLGKPIAGGIPCAVFGVTASVADRMRSVQSARAKGDHGHSGMGTTLSANAFALHAVKANLEHVMTPAAYEKMLPLARYLKQEVEQKLKSRNLAWSVIQIGSRCEFQFCPVPPRNGRQAEAAFHDSLESCIHLGLLNRGVMITPFHNMMLVCPQTSRSDIGKLVDALGQILDELNNA